jgi:hypothetical protein
LLPEIRNPNLEARNKQNLKTKLELAHVFVLKLSGVEHLRLFPISDFDIRIFYLAFFAFLHEQHFSAIR